MSLYVHEIGTPGAPCIVFLHGIGTSGWMWAPQIAALDDFHCLNVDLPGHGQSNRVPWVSLRDTARQIAAIIEAHATRGRAHVVGLSLGGYLGLALLERHAEVLDRVVMSGVTAAPMPNRALLRPQLALLSVLLKRRWLARQQAQALHLSPEMQAAFTANLQALSMPAYRRIYTEAAYYRVPPSLRSVDTYTLVVAGSREAKIITDAVCVIAGMLPHAEGRFAPGLGHGWNIEDPDLFSAMVRAWITGKPLPSRLQAVGDGNRTA